MLEKISEQTAQEVLGYIKASKEFVIEQAPILCKEVLNWEAAKFTIIAVCFVGVIALLLFMTKKLKQWAYDRVVCPCSSDRDFLLGARIFVFIIVVPALLGIIIPISNIVKIYVAPRVYLLEYLTGLVK